VVVVRGVVAALEPGYSSFVIADKNSAVIEAGKAPRHDDHFTGSLPRGSHHPGDASRPSLGSFVGVPLGDLVAVPERLRNKGRGTSAGRPLERPVHQYFRACKCAIIMSSTPSSHRRTPWCFLCIESEASSANSVRGNTLAQVRAEGLDIG
jgi:hypothetical protein